MKRFVPAIISAGLAVILVTAACTGPMTPPAPPASPADFPPTPTKTVTPVQQEAGPEPPAKTASALPTPSLALTATLPGLEPASLAPGAGLSATLPGLPAEPLALFQLGGAIFSGDAARPTPQALGDVLQGAGVDAASLTPFVQLFPELRRMPAPDWLREGQRTTYYVQSASIAQRPGDDGSGGAGYVQNDLVALDNASAVVSTKFYLDEGGGKLTASTVAAGYGLPGAGDYWLNPAVLTNAERAASDELAVLRMPTTIGGETYNAVRFQYNSGQAEYVWMFDEDSGILLFYRHAIGTENDRYRQLADSTLVNTRQIALPWRGQSRPAWASAGTRLEYAGSYTVLIPGSPATSLPYGVTSVIKQAQARWTSYTFTDYLYGRVNGSGERVTGVGQIFDGLWLPREALRMARLRPWTDRDPVTGSELRLARGADDDFVLTETGPTYETTLIYDGNDGTLLAVEQRTQVGLATNVVELRLVD